MNYMENVRVVFVAIITMGKCTAIIMAQIGYVACVVNPPPNHPSFSPCLQSPSIDANLSNSVATNLGIFPVCGADSQ